MRLLQAHPWPGNVRELFSVLESAFIRAEGGARIEAQHLPPEIRESAEDETLSDLDAPERYAVSVSPENEREAIVAALEEAGGIRTQAAQILGMGRTTLWRKLKEYGIEAE
jgi:transcriptional regulator of acetoin/glycerol metabolism